MNTDAAIKELDHRIKESKKTLDLGQSLERLRNNRDFKRVVLEGYFCEEAIRLVSLKQEPQVQSKDSQESIVRQIDAIGTFQGFLREIDRQTDQAVKTIEDCEQMREEILAEGDE